MQNLLEITLIATILVVGLQNYDPDADYQLLFSAELKNDIHTVITCGAAGFVVFRYTPGKYITYKVATAYKKIRYRKGEILPVG